MRLFAAGYNKCSNACEHAHLYACTQKCCRSRLCFSKLLSFRAHAKFVSQLGFHFLFRYLNVLPRLRSKCIFARALKLKNEKKRTTNCSRGQPCFFRIDSGYFSRTVFIRAVRFVIEKFTLANRFFSRLVNLFSHVKHFTIEPNLVHIIYSSLAVTTRARSSILADGLLISPVCACVEKKKRKN